MFKALLRIRLVLGFLVASLVVGPPAFAHSALVSTNPAPNSTVELGPRLIKLGFSTPFLFLNDTYSAELQIESSSGDVLTPECSSAEIRTLLSIYDLAKPGEYRAKWRAVSDDGHVIGGSHLFSVSSSQSQAKSSAEMCAELGLQLGQVKKSSSQTFDDSGSEYFLWIDFGLLAVLLSFLAYRFSKKSKTGSQKLDWENRSEREGTGFCG